MTQPRRLAFYGKGGVGKSTIATGVSLHLALSGKKVLHIGCDPKSDSSLVLVRGDRFRTVISKLGEMDLDDLEREDLIMKGVAGIDCIESGGPEAGIGCGGRAVSKAFEIYDDLGVVEDGDYDVVVYDVLGDVVCGGFAAPMRRAAGSLVSIVLSEEVLACFAANNIAKAVERYAKNGITLAGLVVNLRSNHADLDPIHRFAEAIGTKVISVVPRDPLVGVAELQRQSVVEYANASPVARSIRFLADRLMAMDRTALPVPTPLSGDGVRDVMRGDLTGDSVSHIELPTNFPMEYGLG
jgi:nitrogenase iron protein NifH